MPASAPQLAPSRATFLFAAASVLGVIGARLWFSSASGVLFEDALITLRYAENLAGGHGFVFNVGERVLGTTTPLFTVLLALLAVPAGVQALPQLAIGLGILSDAGSAALLFALGHRARVPLGVPILAATLFAVGPYTNVTAVSGMETSLVVFLMFASLTLVLFGRPLAASVVMGALVLCRIDGLVWVAMVVVVVMVSERRFPWREALSFVAVLIPWIAFAMLYFGSAVPNTIAAKLVAYPVSAAPGAAHFLSIWNPLHEFAGPEFVKRGFDVLLGLGTLAIVRSHRSLLPVPLFFGAYFGFLFFKVPGMFTWYLIPLVVCAYVIVAVGAGELWRLASRLMIPLVPRFAVVAALPIALVTFEFQTARSACQYWALHMENERTVREAAGRWLKERSAERATVYTEAIGFIGYYSNRYVWDSVGLVSPRIIEFRRASPDNAWFAKSIKELRPDYIVLRTYEVEENLLFPFGGPLMSAGDHAWFQATYDPVREFKAGNELWGKLGRLTIFALRPDTHAQ
jgi:hypothetical protein